MGLRLYLDDCANDHLLRHLLESPPHSHDVEDPFEAGIAGCDDDVHLTHAREDERIIVTKNPDDYWALHDEDPHHLGIFAIFQENRLTDMKPADIVQAIGNLVAAFDDAGLSLTNQVHVLNYWRYPARHSPA